MQVMVNLVPEARLTKLKQRRNKRVITTVAVLIAIVVGTVVGTLVVLLGANVAISKSNEATISKLRTDAGKYKAMEQDASTLQEHMLSFKQKNDSRLLVNKIFEHFGNTYQDGVKVQSFSVSADYMVTISGTAKTLRLVSVFDKAIEEYNVNYKPKSIKNYDGQPFSDVKITSTSKADSGEYPISFSMTFKADKTFFERGKTSGETK